MANSELKRINIPEILSGDFNSILIGTYGADLQFAERYIFPSLPRSVRNKVVLADSRQLSRGLSETSIVRRMNRSYIAAPVRSNHAHHPKFILLSGPNQGRLVVGSGNLSISGYTGAGEIFTSYDWSTENQEELEAFNGLQSFISSMQEAGLIDSIATRLIADQWRTAPWILGKSRNLSPVIHNLDSSFLDQVDERLAGRSVVEIVAAAPFHDRRGIAVDELLTRFRPKIFTLLVQSKNTTLDVKAVMKVFKGTETVIRIKEVTAPDPYSKTFLHGKFVLFRLRKEDLILQGSANLSGVALCLSGNKANVEVCNILEATKGSFDGIVETLNQIELPDISSFVPAEFEETEQEEVSTSPILESVWRSPVLQLTLNGKVNTDDIQFRLGSDELVPNRVEIDVQNERTLIRVEFDEFEALDIGQAIRLFVTFKDKAEFAIFPYHVDELIRASNPNFKGELLKNVADLDLNDKELVELVSELDRIMIVDNRSFWKIANPEDVDTSDEDLGVAIKYEDLDWNRIGEHPTMRQYQSFSNSGINMTELGIVMAELVGKFRAPVQAAKSGRPRIWKDEDLSIEQAREDAEELDDSELSDLFEEEGKRINNGNSSHNGLMKRKWRNFIARFVSGISDVQYRKAAGSYVIVSGYIVFNHLCHRLRVLEKIDSDFLTETQIRLWEFMWGTAGKVGYLGELDAKEKELRLKDLLGSEDLPLTLASIENAFQKCRSSDTALVSLRNVVRGILINPDWNPDSLMINLAVANSSSLEVKDGPSLCSNLLKIVSLTSHSERDFSLAEVLGIKKSDLIWTQEKIKRNAVEEIQKVLNLPDKYQLHLELAQSIIATLLEYEPNSTYFRIKAGKKLVIVDLDQGYGTFYDLSNDVETEFGIPKLIVHPWVRKVQDMLEAA